MEPPVLETTMTPADVAEFEKLISYWCVRAQSIIRLKFVVADDPCQRCSIASFAGVFVCTLNFRPDFSSASSPLEATTPKTTPDEQTSSDGDDGDLRSRQQHIRQAFSYGRLLWTSLHQRTPITKSIVLDPAVFEMPVKLDGIMIKLKVGLSGTLVVVRLVC